jgi:hypothetical protein
MAVKVRGNPNVRNSVLGVSGENTNLQIADEVFYVLLTLYFGTNLVNNQLDAQFLCIYFVSLQVSSNPVLISRRINCINTKSGTCTGVSQPILT